jgi:L-cysteine S-thiosulfotransferase
MKWLAALFGAVCLAAWPLLAQQPGIPSGELKSGIEFAGPDIRALQADDFDNPGMLWVTRGEKLWTEPAGRANRSCSGCHSTESMKGVSARYPKVDGASGALLNIEGRINVCRERHQQAEPFAAESDDLLGLSAWLGYQSRGMPMAVTIDDAARPYFNRGRDLYYRRIGQMNLACANCHEQNWGRTLLNERISQGHGNGFPAYRLEWQRVGSLERRLRACLFGIRAEMLPYGAPEYRELALFLGARASGLRIETPAVRR